MPDLYVPFFAREWGRIPVGDGVDIAYTERGSGPPVVFVPGWTMSGEVFEHQLAELAPSFRVITFDPRSHGRSTITAAGNNYPQHGRDLVALLDALGLTGIHLVAWSYGALACWSAIEQEGPEWLRSLTVLDQTPKPLAMGAVGEWAEMDLTEFLDEEVGPMVADRDAFATEFAAWLLGRAPESHEQLAAMHLTTPCHAAVSLQVSAMFSDYRELAGSLNSCLPLAYAISREWLDEAKAWLSVHTPGAALWAMPSHLGFWDSPVEFNARLTTSSGPGSEDGFQIARSRIGVAQSSRS